MVAHNDTTATGPTATNSNEKTPLLTSRNVTANNGATASSPTSRFTLVATIGAVALVVLGIGTAAYTYHQYTLRSEFADAVRRRTIDYMASVPNTCQSCSVVIPSNTYVGRGLGGAIDASDCVVRFNAHVPAVAPAEDYGRGPGERARNEGGGRGGALCCRVHIIIRI